MLLFVFFLLTCVQKTAQFDLIEKSAKPELSKKAITEYSAIALCSLFLPHCLFRSPYPGRQEERVEKNLLYFSPFFAHVNCAYARRLPNGGDVVTGRR